MHLTRMPARSLRIKWPFNPDILRLFANLIKLCPRPRTKNVKCLSEARVACLLTVRLGQSYWEVESSEHGPAGSGSKKTIEKGPAWDGERETIHPPSLLIEPRRSHPSLGRMSTPVRMYQGSKRNQSSNRTLINDGRGNARPSRFDLDLCAVTAPLCRALVTARPAP